MLSPADIEARDFLVVVHGYHKGEVREFLSEIAASYADLTSAATASERTDDFESMGSEIASVLRAAKEAAAVLTSDAEERLRTATAEADEKLASASREAEALLATAESIRAESARDAQQLRANADIVVADARREADTVRAEADRIIAEAHEAARRIEDEARERAEAHHRGVEASIHERLAELGEHEATIRDRLLDLSAAVRAAGGVLDTDAAAAAIDLRATQN
jgi:DivIVA domain-containing protein